MLNNCWFRVDDRLIHGQVTVGWRQRLRFDRVWVVDDALQGDPIMRDVLRLAAPAGVQVHVCGVEEAARALGAGEGAGRCLVLLKSPAVALALVEAGLALGQLNVGNVAAGPGSRRAFKSVSLTPQQAAALDAMDARGVRVVFQQTPDDPAVEWAALRGRVS
ncbi:MAG: PTS sugar transporter subunit IIB [Anaerolineae bacterium]|nr:PTS sugar transporter subunit IIB [Anaerolineae bacterium]